MQDLKPCPFCGSSAHLINRVETYGHGDFEKEWYVHCVAKSCGARMAATSAFRGSDVEKIESAAANWNLRTPENTTRSKER